MLDYYLVDPDTDVYQTEQPQISYSVDFKAEQSSAIGHWLFAIGYCYCVRSQEGKLNK